MDAYYKSKSGMPYFKGAARQRGSGFGSLALSVGRVALPIARKFIVPAAKSLGKELVSQAVPELLQVAKGKKSLKRAARSSVRKTAVKQLGGGRKRKKRTSSTKSRKKRSTKTRKKTTIKRTRSKSRRKTRKNKKFSKRSRLDIFENL